MLQIEWTGEGWESASASVSNLQLKCTSALVRARCARQRCTQGCLGLVTEHDSQMGQPRLDVSFSNAARRSAARYQRFTGRHGRLEREHRLAGGRWVVVAFSLGVDVWERARLSQRHLHVRADFAQSTLTPR